ncbi:hypothetical protein JW905_07805 [bacterium]|nr:hypothetical protein [candidate division CSSED10-310 bacterium]
MPVDTPLPDHDVSFETGLERLRETVRRLETASPSLTERMTLVLEALRLYTALSARISGPMGGLEQLRRREEGFQSEPFTPEA